MQKELIHFESCVVSKRPRQVGRNSDLVHRNRDEEVSLVARQDLNAIPTSLRILVPGWH
jgi:hypothetical protein